MCSLYVGVDIAKLSFDAAFIANGIAHHQTFANNTQGFRALAGWLSHFSSAVKITMEATGVYWEKLAYWSVSKGWQVSVVNPLQIKAYATSIAQRSKTDKLDALLLARFARNEKPTLWQPPNDKEYELRALMRQLRHTRLQLQREQSRLESAPDCIRQLSQKNVAYWQQEIESIEQIIMTFIDTVPLLKARADLLLTVPGVGKKTLPWLLTYLGDGMKFSCAKKVASFAGLAPRLHESGTSVRGKSMIGKSGLADLRSALFMPALVVSFGRHKAFQPFVQRLLANGKRRKEVVIAMMRKILTVAYGVLRSGQPYRKELHAL
ncbi:IS110 family transposase [Cardiobacteriaceae bacterium TAE3-ERU3]|nr:IS110 family transposase [Cardiobacteriaceae bacterium TAE3-ERU3]